MSYSDGWLQVTKKGRGERRKEEGLDGPDSFSNYFHGLRKLPLNLFSKGQGEDSVMVW